ncbi:AAA family ATPase [uncultured Lamprocystis sp.]|uniref:AAA family ATPase n=1 Tax=uncultured Lamprocystis sp. TaxID=543132 RepID=UPI0025CFDFCA|nr:AAA family ATPase [uncultured Lamprocystis sp.]
MELDHPAVLIGPNNCGKTTAIQAIALWSQAVRTWRASKGKAPPKERTSTSLNRLNIVSVPVARTRYFWHNTAVRTGNTDIPLLITLGVLHRNKIEPVTVRFRNQGDELVYCTPDDAALERPDLIETAAALNVELLYPMSGLETEEPILQPGRIGVLLGQGQTAQVLRNLCLLVFKDAPADWRRIAILMRRLFTVDLGDPTETARGSITLFYRQERVKEPLDIALAGRGFQQMLLIFAYLYSHRRSVLLIDEPDAHLEILRQKQVYVLLREIAAENESQVILVTHSEVILEEALDHNLTLLLGGQTDDIAAKSDIKNALKHYGAEHYVRARQRGYVLYVEGGTDLEILKALANRLGHRVAKLWDERVNAFYVQDNFPDPNLNSELERVEGGFGVTPKKHFFALRNMVPSLAGLAILDNDGRQRQDSDEGGLHTVYWSRYEAENYFITPELLRNFAIRSYQHLPLFGQFQSEIDEVLDELITERVFGGRARDLEIWRSLDQAAARLLWEARTERVKLSEFAEAFFRRLAARLGHAMLLRKGEFYRLVDFVDPQGLPEEVTEKLDLLAALFAGAAPGEEA